MSETDDLKWGVDSVSRIDADRTARLPGLPRNTTLFEHVSNFVRPPEFWGRYLNARTRGCLNRDEVEALIALIRAMRTSGRVAQSYSCRILPIYNQCTRTPSRFQGRAARRNGLAAARDAVNRAELVGIPPGVCIYADLEMYRVDQAWFEGWFEGMYESLYYGVGGIYGNAKARHFDARNGRQQGWRENIDDAFYAFESRTNTLLRRDPDTFDGQYPYLQLYPFDISLTKRVQTLIFTNRSESRRTYISVNSDMPRGQEIPAQFEGSSPEDLPEDNTVVWQYAGNMHLGADHHMVDYNLSKQKGFDVMWDPMR